MTHLREHWEGVSLPGEYTLEQWLGGDDNAAFFLTSPAADGRRAVVKLIPAEVGQSAAQLDLWQRTRQLRHANLIELFDCGRADHAGEIVLYAVFESPDETLASALSRSPLTPQESREVLDSVLASLRYLHKQGLVLGTLDADHVVAVGDLIKLSTGDVREAANSSAYAGDVCALGEFWRQALMSASPMSAEIAAHAADPDPNTRWTLAEIITALALAPAVVNPPAPPPEASAPLVVLPPEVPLLASPPLAASPAALPPAAIHPVVPKPTPMLPPPRRQTQTPTAPYSFPRWIVGAAAAVLVLILGLNLRHPAEVATQSRVAEVSLPKESPVRESPVTNSPAPVHLPPPKAAVPKVIKPSPLAGKEMWRVIAFTYRTHEAAAKKASQLNQFHPDIHAMVFTPKGQRGYYLVALGGRMTHEEALHLQHTARGKGLPRDLFVQNYLE